ncbi:hypothetical protein F2P45_22010 [Massilia sp. CCM 8733]|uniref:DUF5625 domain-containing protein n=1 Tax=Massilia mucilaginosa TaxID=2609282 RepID=A0ABX0NXL8_9BURK|nr:DUF5625 family protein [Massilia mucilaginosa]NHZ91660.1 hypothetical protein [Massilia mucilaginosa]
MGPIAYSLCQKPVIGLVMHITFACSFPPLIADQPLALSEAGVTASTAFSVPVDKRYSLDLTFAFQNAWAMRQDEIVGSRYDKHCEPGVNYGDIPVAQLPGLGRPIPFRVAVQRKSDKAVVIERTFTSLCKVSGGIDRARKTRQIGRLDLTRGEYILVITNLERQAGLDGVATSFSLVPGHGK